jgi:hypothetical protein
MKKATKETVLSEHRANPCGEGNIFVQKLYDYNARFFSLLPSHSAEQQQLKPIPASLKVHGLVNTDQLMRTYSMLTISRRKIGRVGSSR